MKKKGQVSPFHKRKTLLQLEVDMILGSFKDQCPMISSSASFQCSELQIMNSFLWEIQVIKPEDAYAYVYI